MEFRLPGSAVWLPPPPPPAPAAAPAGASAAPSAGRVRAQPRRADLAPDLVRRGERGSGVVGPGAGERQGEGAGGREGRGGQWRVPGRLLRGVPRPPAPPHLSRSRPRPRAPLPAAGVAGCNRGLSGWSSARPAPASAGVLPPELPRLWQLPDPHRSGRPLSPARRVRPPLRRPPPLTPYPGLGNEPHRSLSPAQAAEGGWRPPGAAERSGAPCRSGPRRVAAATPGVCGARARRERRARGEQVPAARRAHGSGRAEAVSDGRGGAGGRGEGERPHDSGRGRFRAGGVGVPAPHRRPLRPHSFFGGRAPPTPVYCVLRGTRGGGGAKGLVVYNRVSEPMPRPAAPHRGLCGGSVWSPKGGGGWAGRTGLGATPTARLGALWLLSPWESGSACGIWAPDPLPLTSQLWPKLG